MSALFACTRCMSRHPFEELSPGQQLCKDCRGAFPVIKCTYCRTEFQESSKGGTISVCRKCEQNLKLYGKPTSCEYCNIIAAFIGSKCQRCTNSEKKYGSPVICDQCKQRCAFDRKDDSRKKVDGKLLCWLCTLSYKRALAKAKQNLSSRQSSLILSKSSSHRSSQNHKHSSSHSSRSAKNSSSNISIGEANASPNKKFRLEQSKSANGILPSSDSGLLDSNTSDHLVALTLLRDQIDVLQKQLSGKDQQIVAKDRQIGEMKAQHGIIERELRLRIQEMQKQYNDTVQDLQSKVRVFQKQVVTLQKGQKKNSTDSPQRL